MNISSLLKLTLASVAGLAAAHTGSAQNIWLAEPGELVVTPNYTFQSYDTFYAGTARMSLPDDITQRTSSLRFDYGLAPGFALDASVGYTEVKFSPPGANFKRSGRDDSQLGLTYAILQETAERPALTLRVGAIFAGNYDVPTTLPPINPGDGASGFETSLAAGKSFGDGFAAYGELGYRNRNHGVPDDLFGTAGLAKQFGAFGVNIGYRRTQGLSGGDIGGPGFGTSFGFPGVKEITQFVEGGLAFTDGGGRSYRFLVAERMGTVRNTGDATIYNFSISLPFKF
ncbi:hypothetical protein [Opitutus terrae]|uniref:Transporter n=1 Tax=Opitutus terrae (strain DSM 11246 / JCM 15787 / PB90-1) TaxID=452637 RepID=B1ZQA7_OPITP|nr:hypothetical protein [Opitutus terrae]ACB73587.1 hypothetical protein Oter_0297 [Opitutus terrae PB90-1]